MAKLLFDIEVAHEPAEQHHAHLVMEVSQHIFSYALMTSAKKILQLRFYEMDAPNGQALANELNGILLTDEIVKADTARKTWMYNFPDSQLVPAQYFNTPASEDMVALFHGDLNKGITLSEKIEGQSQYNVFRVPEEVHTLLKDRFGTSRYKHYYSVWMQCGYEQPPAEPTYISVMFYPHRVLVAVVIDRQLHLVQSYLYEAAEDVGYYLLNICGQLGLSAQDTPVILSGMIDVSSALYTEIFKYFAQVSLDVFPGEKPESAFQDYPDHFFSPLLKLAICVS